jgi:hypothetical protein
LFNAFGKPLETYLARGAAPAASLDKFRVKVLGASRLFAHLYGAGTKYSRHKSMGLKE